MLFKTWSSKHRRIAVPEKRLQKTRDAYQGEDPFINWLSESGPADDGLGPARGVMFALGITAFIMALGLIVYLVLFAR